MRWRVRAPRIARFFAKNIERPLGITMKKLITMLLVFSLMLCLPGCKLFKGKGSGVGDICEIARNAAPTKIITEVNMVTKAGHSLAGYYVTSTDGTNAIFEYEYQRLATPEESVALGDSSLIITEKGVINYKDGVFVSGDGETWRPGTGTALELRLNFEKSLFKGATVSEDGNELTATLSADELAEFIGTDLNTVGDATVTVSTNGRNLTLVTISCSTANGDLIIRTSYTYNRQNLFPEVVEGEEA